MGRHELIPDDTRMDLRESVTALEQMLVESAAVAL